MAALYPKILFLHGLTRWVVLIGALWLLFAAMRPVATTATKDERSGLSGAPIALFLFFTVMVFLAACFLVAAAQMRVEHLPFRTLLREVPINVSRPLGHSSVKITEMHYAKWMAAR